MKEKLENPQIRDTQALAERIERFVDTTLNKLDIDSKQIDFVDQDNKQQRKEFQAFIKWCREQANQLNYEVVAVALAGVFLTLPEYLSIIKNDLQFNIHQIVQHIDDISEALEQKELYIEQLESDLMGAQKEIMALKDEMKTSQLNNMQRQLDQMAQFLMKGGQMPETYFDERLNENVAKVHGLELKKLPPEPIKEDKSEKIQNAHEEVIDYLKTSELIPLHKINPDSAKLNYKVIWENIAPRYDLSNKDMPWFIDKLEEFYDMPDEYLDVVSEVERL